MEFERYGFNPTNYMRQLLSIKSGWVLVEKPGIDLQKQDLHMEEE